jgi:tetratricopeptide (TPR) repeat protein
MAVSGAIGVASAADESLVPWNRDDSHHSRAGHPVWRRCSSLTYAQYARSSRLASRAPRSGPYASHHGSRGLALRVITGFDAPAPSQVPADDPDALYRDRENPASARRAADIWAERLKTNGKDVESAWKLGRASYWLGTNGLPENERRAALEQGVNAGRTAADIAPDRPEGHFWMAANMGALAESYGLRQGLRYRGQIRDELERVLAIDPAFLEGSADRALGRWYFMVPRLFGGNKRKSEEHLRKALAYNPQSVITHLFLAETLIDLDRKDEARQELQAAIDAPRDPEWEPEDRRFKQEAEELLKGLR